jgi:hypothetical protein
MAQFVAFEEGMEVNGTTIMAVVDGLSFFTGGLDRLANQFLQEADLEAIVPDEKHWYPQQSWLDVFKRITEQLGDENLFMIGKNIPKNAVFPKEIDSIEKALSLIDVAYHMNHRNKNGEILFDPNRSTSSVMLEGIGHYTYQKVEGENKAIIKCENPYPCAFDRGLIEAMAKRFVQLSLVKHDDSAPCRQKGAESCTYQITWAQQ